MAALCHQRHKEITEPASKGTPSSILKQLHGVWFSDIYGHPCYNAKLLWALASTAFFGFFRLGELLPSLSCNLSPLLLTDLAADSHENPSLFILLIRRAKNDSFGKGTQVILGSTLSPLCPVKALKEFLEARLPSPEPLFITEDASPLLKEAFVSEVHRALKTAGLKPSLYQAWGKVLWYSYLSTLKHKY